MEFGDDDDVFATPGPSTATPGTSGLNPDHPPSMLVGSPLDRILKASLARSQAKREARRQEKEKEGTPVNLKNNSGFSQK